jgi:hypothetical protein
LRFILEADVFPGKARLPIFRKAGDDEAFEGVLAIPPEVSSVTH